MAPKKLDIGVKAMHDIDKGGDGRTGVVKGRMTVELENATQVNILIEYTDYDGVRAAQAWFPEDACTIL